jgi:hypothetical protein
MTGGGNGRGTLGEKSDAAPPSADGLVIGRGCPAGRYNRVVLRGGRKRIILDGSDQVLERAEITDDDELFAQF